MYYSRIAQQGLIVLDLPARGLLPIQYCTGILPLHQSFLLSFTMSMSCVCWQEREEVVRLLDHRSLTGLLA